ncbi:signal peptide peptidase-domain-containing protein [Mortierella sp. GBAus27b]|nr:hypothetical protein BGX31_004808 [Mortierella sp. GBA43]KAI8354788.1 signal peptide peptidase-domain-containing protein [Mortierella sp. GBAus27b]
MKYVTSTEAVGQDLYIAYTALTLMAVLPIYFGSFASLKRWKNPKETSLKRQIQEPDEPEDSDDLPSELVSFKDACILPLVPVGLSRVYDAMITNGQLDRTYISYALTAYFGIMGALATAQAVAVTLTAITKLVGIKLDSWHVSLVRKPHEFYTAKFSLIHLFALMVSVFLSAYYVATKNWVASNVLAFGFALSSVQVFSLESFQVGLVLMSGMTSYDFLGTPDESTPFKIAFPRLLLSSGQASKFTALGLSDLVVPGLFAALCLRFDQHRAGMKNPELGGSTKFRKPYFTGCIVAYVLGLGSMFILHHVTTITFPPQLYLNPACALSLFMSAAVRGELKQVFGFLSEEGRLAIKKKNEARERKARQRTRMVAKSSSRVSRLPNIVKEESFVPAPRSTAQENLNESR